MIYIKNLIKRYYFYKLMRIFFVNEKVDWNNLCENPNAIDILEKMKKLLINKE